MPRKAKTKTASDLGVRIGRNIKQARQRAGLTQNQLAEALEVESVTVSRIETGAQLPSIERLDRIAATLGTELSILVADHAKPDSAGKLYGEAVRELPAREKEFLYGFVAQYVEHYRSGKRK